MPGIIPEKEAPRRANRGKCKELYRNQYIARLRKLQAVRTRNLTKPEKRLPVAFAS